MMWSSTSPANRIDEQIVNSYEVKSKEYMTDIQFICIVLSFFEWKSNAFMSL